MKLIQLSNKTLINPEYVSHITVRTEPAPKDGGQYAHDYPIYRITMYDGKWFDIAFKNYYPNEYYPWDAIHSQLEDMQKNG